MAVKGIAGVARVGGSTILQDAEASVADVSVSQVAPQH
jgi:hypothetical protein